MTNPSTASLPQFPTGLPKGLQPYCPINITEETFWEIVGRVNRTLKHCGYPVAAAEFRAFSQTIGHDTGQLLMLAMDYVRVTNEEE